MKRLLASVLALAMVLVACFMAGCGGDADTTTTKAPTKPVETTTGTSGTEPVTPGTNPVEPGDETTEGSDPTETTADPGVIVEPGIDDWDGYTKLAGFQNVNFRGKTFVIAGETGTDDRWDSSKEIYSDDTSPIQTAVRDRNLTIEKLYNCTIEPNASDNPSSLAMAEVTGGQHTIDMFTAKYGGAGLATGGNCYNLFTLGIDFTNEWWDQNYISTYTIKNSSGVDTLYGMVGDFSLSAFAATHAIFFNKNVYETAIAQGLGYDIYQLVRDGEWTMDIFVEMIKKAGTDNSGNSEYHYDEGDILGWARTTHATHGLHTASALPIISNTNGVLSFDISANASQWTTVIDKAIEVWSVQQGESLGYTDVQDAVANGNTLFASEVLDVLERMKDIDGTSFGLVPYPKYSTTQQSYAHYVDNHIFSYHVPTSVSEIAELGQFIELYAAHSRKIVRSAWIDTYAYEYCGDSDSAEMLDIVLNSRTYDPGYLYWTLEGEISQMISEGKNNVIQWANRRTPTVSGAGGSIETYINGISDNEA